MAEFQAPRSFLRSVMTRLFRILTPALLSKSEVFDSLVVTFMNEKGESLRENKEHFI